jgi:ArsR family transcriptional regulator, virulence genes transcriptional regulator
MELMTPDELEPMSANAARLLAALANQKRLMIMSYLFQGELSVTALAERVALSQSALSQHLAKLRKLDIVGTRRDGQTIYYSAKGDRSRIIVDAVCKAFVAA